MILKTIKFISVCVLLATKGLLLLIHFLSNDDEPTESESYDFGSHHDSNSNNIDTIKSPSGSYVDDIFISIDEQSKRI